MFDHTDIAAVFMFANVFWRHMYFVYFQQISSDVSILMMSF